MSGNILTIMEVLERRAQEMPGNIVYRFLADDKYSQNEVLSFEELRLSAIKFVPSIKRLASDNDRVLLLFPPGLDYIKALFACFYAGVIAVPAYPPTNARNSSRVNAIVKDAGAVLALSTTELQLKLQDSIQVLHWLSINDPVEDTDCVSLDQCKPDNVAFLQYTSGTTGTPKGVSVTHRNLYSNATLLAKGMGLREDTVGVNWLPPYHDMGLVGGILQSVFHGGTAILMSPIAFMRRPFRWLKAISEFKGTVCGAPNFAYDLCVQKINEDQLEELDLSSWQVAFSGAEPVLSQTINMFSEYFSAAGFERNSFYPCYGLAETTLVVAGGKCGDEPRVKTLDRLAVTKEGGVAREEAADEKARTYVSVGQPLVEELLIIRPDSRELCLSGEVGEIWVRGENVTQGYWQKESETQIYFKAQLAGIANAGKAYLRTGDLGFLDQGDLFITGRLKEVVIINGRNFYPQDIEPSCYKSHKSLRQNGVAAFTVEIEAKERLVIIQELEFGASVDTDDIFQAILSSLRNELDLTPYAIAIVKAGRIPRTTSGKIQRTLTKQLYLKGELSILEEWRAYAARGDLSKPVTDDGELPERLDLNQDIDTDVKGYLIGLLSSRYSINPQSLNSETSFFEMGLSSIEAVELLHELSLYTGIQIPHTLIWDHPTINELTTVLAEKNASSSERCTVNVQKTGILQSELSSAQKRMWFLEQLNGECGRYNIPVLLKLTGDLNYSTLSRCFNILVQRQEVLRTYFIEKHGHIEQVVKETQKIKLPLIDCSALPLNELEGFLKNIGQCERTKRFDLSQAPLMRIALIYHGPSDWYLSVNMHHIISDAKSLYLVAKELKALYSGITHAAEEQVALPVQYIDYALYERASSGSENYSAKLNYWKQALSGAPELLSLPSEKSRLSETAYNSALTFFSVDKALYKGLQSISKQYHTTLFNALLAVYALVLSRYSSQNDICIGVPVSVRSKPELQDLIGNFINTVVVRADLSEDINFKEFLAELSETSLNAYKNQEIPFDVLVDELGVARSPGQNPLFQAMLVFRDEMLPESIPGDSGGIALDVLDEQLVIANIDISLELIKHADGLKGRIEYNGQLFDRSLIDSIAESYLLVLKQLVNQPDLSLCAVQTSHAIAIDNDVNNVDLSLLSPDRQLLINYFEDWVRKEPNAVAVICGDQEISYKSLDKKAAQLAAFLIEKGVNPESCVGVCLDRSADMVVALLGVMKAGGCYVPIDPKQPATRKAHIIQDSSPSVLISEKSLLASPEFPCVNADCVLLEIDEVLGFDKSPPALQSKSKLHELSPENSAYVIYTSGSTGKPKGVVIEHKSLINLLLSAKFELGLVEGDILLSVTSLGFDISALEIFLPLISGARVVIADRSTVYDGAALSIIIDRDNVSIMQATPSTWQLLLDSGWIPRPGFKMLCGGEAWSISLAQRLMQNGGILWNAYGPTETTIWSSINKVRASDHKIYIGKPIDNTQFYILDEHMNAVPLGAAGELYIGGAGLAREYLNKRELTLSNFVFDKERESRLYRTGDLVRTFDFQNIEYLARLDDQIKIRGYRIELGEIESCLRSCAGVKNSLVLLRQVDANGSCLIAYLIKDPAKSTDWVTLRSSVESMLPSYMIPRFHVWLDAFPLTINGKIDKKSLPPPDLSGSSVRAMPSSATEIGVLEIWSTVLKSKHMDVTDNFFELGGHSLLINQVISLIYDRFNVEVTVKDFFQKPTVRDIASLIDSSDGQLIVPIKPLEKSDYYAVSTAQLRLWLLANIGPESNAYNIAAIMPLPDGVEIELLNRSINQLIARHEPLRTVFAYVDGQVVQQILSPFELELPAETEVAEEAVADVFNQISNYVYSLESGPLFQARMLITSNGRKLLLWSMHEIIADGISSVILQRELSQLLNAYLGNETVSLPSLSVQYKDFAAWQNNQLMTKNAQLSCNYWLECLCEPRAYLNLPYDFMPTAGSTHQGATYGFALPEDLYLAIKKYIKSEGVTLFMFLQAVLVVLFYRLTGQKDIILVSPVSGREHPDVEGLVGFFLNTVVLRQQIDNNNKFDDVLNGVKESTSSCLAHQHYPFEILLDKLAIDSTSAQFPLSPVMLNLLNFMDADAGFSSYQEGHASNHGKVKIDMEIDVYQFDHSLAFHCEYKSQLFKAESIEYIMREFSDLMRQCVRTPAKSVSGFDLFSSEKRVDGNGKPIEINSAYLDFMQ